MFPNEFPIEHVTELIGLIRAGKVTENPAHSLKLAFWIVGCSIEVLDGDVVTTADCTCETLEEAENQALRLLEADKEKQVNALEEDPEKQIDPGTIIAIIELIKFIIEWRNNR